MTADAGVLRQNILRLDEKFKRPYLHAKLVKTNRPKYWIQNSLQLFITANTSTPTPLVFYSCHPTPHFW